MENCLTISRHLLSLLVIVLPYFLNAQVQTQNRTEDFKSLRQKINDLNERVKRVSLQNKKRLIVFKSSKEVSAENRNSMDTGVPPKEEKPKKQVSKWEANKQVAPGYAFSQKEGPSVSKFGVYVLPFFGMYQSNDFNRNFFLLGDLEIEQETGFLSGVRTGKRWEYVYLEAEINFMRNELEGIPGIALPFSGNVSTLSGSLSAGTNLPFSDNLDLFLGGGLGYARQDTEFILGTISAPETSQVMLWQLATGINFTPLSHMLIGLRYRWVYLAEMEDFTDRYMHSFEISLGYEW